MSEMFNENEITFGGVLVKHNRKQIGWLARRLRDKKRSGLTPARVNRSGMWYKPAAVQVGKEQQRSLCETRKKDNPQYFCKSTDQGK